MGPLFKAWTTVEKASNFRFEKVEVSLPEILKHLDQVIMLLDQAFNNISYTRLFHALNQITGDPRKMKQLLKEKIRYLLKKQNFYLVKDLSLISLDAAKRKQKS